jgi:uncharacterized protein (TIRG00374 family)
MNRIFGRLWALAGRGWLRVVVAGMLLWVFVRLVPFRQAWGHALAADWRLLGGAFGVEVSMMLVSALKLWLLVRTNHPEARLGDTVQAYYVGAFFNNFLPTSIGGDVVKVQRLCARDCPLGHATASVIVERGTGVLAVLLLAAAVAFASGPTFDLLNLSAARWPLAAGATGVLVGMVCLYAAWRAGLKAMLKRNSSNPVLGRLRKVIECFYVFRDNPPAMVGAMALSLTFYLLTAIDIAVVTHAVGAPVCIARVVDIVPLLKLPEMVPVSIGALGIREGALSYCLARIGPTTAQAAAIALLLRFLSWLNCGIGGLLYAFGPRTRRDRAEQR